MPQLNANALGSLPISLWMMQLWKRWVGDEILCSQVTRIFNMLGSQQSRPRADHHLFIAPNGTIQPLHPLSRNRGHWTRPMPSIRQMRPLSNAPVNAMCRTQQLSTRCLMLYCLMPIGQMSTCCLMQSKEVSESTFGHRTSLRPYIGQTTLKCMFADGFIFECIWKENNNIN
jgi:hypothetical protein